MSRRLQLFSTLILIIPLLLSACTSDGPYNAAQTSFLSSNTYPVDPLFREFYEHLGGEEVLGAAITTLFYENGVKLQYLETTLMVFDPTANPTERYYLGPLGEALGYHQDAPGDVFPKPNDTLIDGYVIHQPFVDVYLRLGGAQFVGRPLTGPIMNQDRNRIEQHFENIGFYQALGDESGPVYLLNYGVASCDFTCRDKNNLQDAAPEMDKLQKPFNNAMQQLGPAFTGAIIEGPYYNDDGLVEVVYENIVLYMEYDHTFARPIVTQLGYQIQPLTTRFDNPYIVFIPIEDSLGHNVPLFFYDYLTQHGGMDIAGIPISEFTEIKANVFQQCFTNLCLEYHGDAAEGNQIIVTPLGWRYKTDIQPSIAVQIEAPAPQNPAPIQESAVDTVEVEVEPQQAAPIAMNIQFQAWEEESLISSQEFQVIAVTAFNNNQPLAGATFILTVYLPDGSERTYRFMPTDLNGHAEVTLQPILAKNGSLVEYQVCMETPTNNVPCASENFLIWGNP
jgi:hypothetical protein